MSVQSTHSSREPVPGFHAQTAYEIQPENQNAILRISAYHRKDFDLAVIWFSPRAHTDLLTSTLPLSRKPTASLGKLDKLPLELINRICLDLDVASLFRFRQTNIRARQIVAALHEYRIITTHAVNPLCALLRTRLAPVVTLLDFYRLLCTQSCSLCESEYGDLVHLPLWIRCCSSCLRQNSTELRVATLNTVKRILKLSRKSLGKLPKLVTLPGTYTMDERLRSSRVTIVSTASALSAYREEHSGVEASQAMIKQISTQPILAFMACCALPSFDLRTGQAQNGVSCAGCQVAVEEGINTFKGAWAGEMRDAVYSHDGFLKHFTHCEQAQLLWTSSNGGTERPPKLPYSCRKGGYFKHRE
ncbi:cyclin-like F-box [Lizonia empirigonia]|nr:cyclin-like F-box [Lizonia empirigonia]